MREATLASIRTAIASLPEKQRAAELQHSHLPGDQVAVLAVRR